MRWSVEPLIAAAGGHHEPVERRLGTAPSALRRTYPNGLTDWHADRLAVRLGLHPAMIWPGWVEAGLTVLDELHLAGGWRQAWLHDNGMSA